MSITMTVTAYDELSDAFGVTLAFSYADSTQQGDIPGALLPRLTGEYGAPDEFIGRTFTIEA